MDFKIVEIPEKKVLGISKNVGGTASKRFKAEHIMWADDCEHIPAKICSGYDGVWYGTVSYTHLTETRRGLPQKRPLPASGSHSAQQER